MHFKEYHGELGIATCKNCSSVVIVSPENLAKLSEYCEKYGKYRLSMLGTVNCCDKPEYFWRIFERWELIM